VIMSPKAEEPVDVNVIVRVVAHLVEREGRSKAQENGGRKKVGWALGSTFGPC
jgi:hypothetical protein